MSTWPIPLGSRKTRMHIGHTSPIRPVSAIHEADMTIKKSKDTMLLCSDSARKNKCEYKD